MLISVSGTTPAVLIGKFDGDVCWMGGTQTVNTLSNNTMETSKMASFRDV